jgi:hypothetical protein
MVIECFAWGVGNVKGGSTRTYSGIEISAQNRQQLRLDVLQHVLQLSGRVRFSDGSFGQ